MYLGEPEGEIVDLVPLDLEPAPAEPVGLTDTDPATGEVFEVDASDYERVDA